jgi:3-phosphoshikimate 1-carboxyvinyltransferase
MRGLHELRVKESDRLTATAAMLEANGVAVEIDGDDMIVRGSEAGIPGGGTVATHMDHRLAMSALVMGLAAQVPVAVDDAAFIETSFPGFAALVNSACGTAAIVPA